MITRLVQPALSVGCYGIKTLEKLVKNATSLLTSVARSCCMELSIKFVNQDNYASEQKFNWIKPNSSLISGTPFTSIKDNTSSVLFKTSEALSKGAGAKCISRVSEAQIRQINRVYGVSSHSKGNIFSKVLDVPEELLLTCMGNPNIMDPVGLPVEVPDFKIEWSYINY